MFWICTDTGNLVAGIVIISIIAGVLILILIGLIIVICYMYAKMEGSKKGRWTGEYTFLLRKEAILKFSFDVCIYKAHCTLQCMSLEAHAYM